MAKTKAQLASRDSAKIMAEIEQTRAELDQTMSEIAARFDPRANWDRFVQAWRTDGNQYAVEVTQKWARQLLDFVKQHPASIAVIGAGVAWLFVEKPYQKQRLKEWFYPPYSPTQEMMNMHEQESRASEFVSSAAETAQNITEQLKCSASESASKVEESAHRLADWSKEKWKHLGSYGEQMSQQAGQLKGRFHGSLHRTRQRAGEITEEHPFVVGFTALAIGVIIGLALPRSKRGRGRFGERLSEMGRQAEEYVEGFTEPTMESISEQTR